MASRCRGKMLEAHKGYKGITGGFEGYIALAVMENLIEK